MKNYHDYLKDLIKNNNAEFTSTEKKIADFILQQYNEIPFISIHELAKRLEVGRASIMRFTKKIGFEGFLSLKKEINSRMMTTLAPMEKFRLTLNHDILENTLLNEVGQNEVDNINITLNSYNNKNYKNAVNEISKAKIIYTVGFNLSSFIAEIASYLLQRIGVRAITANMGGRSLSDQLGNVEKSDVVIAFSLPPYSEETISATKYAKKHGAKVISFTNSLTSPIVTTSDIVLQVETKSRIFSNSFTAIIVLLYSLVYEVAIKNKTRSILALDERILRKL